MTGGPSTSAGHRPVVLCEVHWLVGEFRSVCAEVLEPAGYEIRRLDGLRIGPEPERYHAVMIPKDGQAR